MPLSDWSLRHPVPTAVITVVLAMFGVIAFVFLNREFIPPVVLPEASVVTVWAGVAAGDVEKEVTAVLEEQFSSLKGLRDMSSVSREGLSIITLQFREGVDGNTIQTELREHLSLAEARLPDNLNVEPVVAIAAASDLPVFVFAVDGLKEASRLTAFVEDVIIPDIYKVEGVGRVRILGGRRAILRVSLKSEVIAELGITATEVLGPLGSRNRVLPVGLVEWEGEEWAFRVSDEFGSVEELENLVVGRNEAGALRLAEIADISEVYEEPMERVRLGGRDVPVVQVSKLDSGNVIEMSRKIRGRLENIEAESGGVYNFRILHDDTETVSRSLNSVLGSALTGVVMAVLIIWFFLRSWRYTLVVAVSLPVSMIVVFAAMILTGQSINVLTMSGITVSLGMVVDASIVVLENIYHRHITGVGAAGAAREGVGQVARAVTASVVTSISVFAPMLFLGGIIGVIMKDISLSIILSLSASLLVALFLVPVLARLNLERRGGEVMGRGRVMLLLERGYGWSLKAVFGMRWVLIPAVLLLLFLSVFLADRIGVSFLPAADYDELYISIEQAPGGGLEQGVMLADRVEELIRSRVPEVSDMLFYVGMKDDLVGADRRRESLWGQLLLTPSEERERGFQELMDELNGLLSLALPDISVTVFNGGFDRMIAQGTEGRGYRVELSSLSMKRLERAADRVGDILASDPDILSIRREVSENRRSVTAKMDGELMGRLGVNALDAALAVRVMFGGVRVGKLRFGGLEGEGEEGEDEGGNEKGGDRDIILTSDMAGTEPNGSSLGMVKLRRTGGGITDFEEVSSVSSRVGVSEIHRRDRSRTFTVIGYPRTEDIRGISTRLVNALNEEPLEAGVEWRIKGVSSLITDSVLDLALVLFISLFLVYGVMAVQFERVRQPLIIMMAVPFCLVGVVGSLVIFGSNLSIISFLGTVALAGIVVNNAIVQIDYINHLLGLGMELEEAVINGAVSRLRPILMTTLTTLFGVMPLSLARGTGARIYAPLGQAIAGGLMSSTIVSLFLIPVLYWMTERHSMRHIAVVSGK